MRRAAAAVMFGGVAFSVAYTIFATTRLLRRARRPAPPRADVPITIAKPLCGLEPGLDENLRSFCQQDYPRYEVIFAVASDEDPAAAVARRVIGECSGVDASLVFAEGGAANRKVASLMAIERQARYPIVVAADSDIRVRRDYLQTIASAFDDPRVGGVTALYAGRSTRSLASRLGAMYVNESFLPSVLVAAALQPLDFMLGATMAVDRDALRAIGGFASVADDLADDYRIGYLLRRHGFTIRLAGVVVDTIVGEANLGDLVDRELRWSRAIRGVRPVGHALTILTMPLVWAAALLLATGCSAAASVAAAAAFAARIGLHLAVRRTIDRSSPGILVPLRDAVTFAVYCASFAGRAVTWRDRRFGVSSDGRLRDDAAAG